MTTDDDDPNVALLAALAEIARLRAEQAKEGARQQLIEAQWAQLEVMQAELASLRAALEWYANDKHWLDGQAGEVDSEIGYHEPGKIPGEWGLMPGCRCGMCLDYWHADNGNRARAALNTKETQ